MPQVELVQNSGELGKLVRNHREQSGNSLRAFAPQAGVGVRFLSEFERGKNTVEFGKVLNTLHALGLDLAVVKRGGSDKVPTDGYSNAIGLEFPYDWSNRQMESSVFINKVLNANRFNDVLKLVGYFGYGRVSRELKSLDNGVYDQVVNTLSNIHKGMLQAGNTHESAL